MSRAGVTTVAPEWSCLRVPDGPAVWLDASVRCPDTTNRQVRIDGGAR